MSPEIGALPAAWWTYLRSNVSASRDKKTD